MPVGEALSQFPRERTWLLPALQAAQRAEGWLSPETLATVAAHVRVPASEVWGVASHYPELRLAKPGRRVVRVCTGVACVARGGERLLERCERRLEIRAGETTRDGALTLEAMDCAFACAVAPVVETDHAYRGRVTDAVLDALLGAPEPVPPLLNALAANRAERAFAAGPDWMAAQRRVLTERCGLADPYDIADALRHGTYGTLARVLEEGRPEAVIEEVRAAGLAGRRGAHFHTAVKWAGWRPAPRSPKDLPINGEGGEPGRFNGRHLQERHPHRLLGAAL